MGTCIIYFYLQGFPKECIEAAQVDGAEEFSIFLRIVLPNMRGIIAILTIYTFSESWNLIDQAVVFIKNNYQLPLSMYLSDILQENMGVISSGSIVYMIPPTLLFIICLLPEERGETRMKHLFTRFCNGFLALALFIGTVDVSMMSRLIFHQPPVPEELLNRVN